MESYKKRIKYIDIAKGISICIVMLFHLKGIMHIEYSHMTETLLFSCCMLPPFFFISGLFFKKEDKFSIFLSKKTKNLLIPFFFFYILSAVIIPNIAHYFFGMKFNTVVGLPSLWAFIWPGEYPNIPIWFLWCLFLSSLLFGAIYQLGQHFFPNYLHMAIIIMSTLCGIVGFFLESILPADIGNICATLKNIPFISIGFLIKRNGIMTTISKASTKEKSLYTLIILFIAAVVTSSLYSQKFNCEAVQFYINGTIGSFLIISMSALIGSLPLISYLGRYSIIVLLTHGILVRIFTPVIEVISIYTWPGIATIICWIIMILLYLAIIPTCKLLLPGIIPMNR